MTGDERQTCPRCHGDGRLPIATMSGPPPACNLCHQAGKVGPTVWLESAWDGEVHAFFGEVHAFSGGVEAACSHSAPAAKLSSAKPGSVPCRRCLAIVGAVLEGRGDWDRRAL